MRSYRKVGLWIRDTGQAMSRLQQQQQRTQILLGGRHLKETTVGLLIPHQSNRCYGMQPKLPFFSRSIVSSSGSQSARQTQWQVVTDSSHVSQATVGANFMTKVKKPDIPKANVSYIDSDCSAGTHIVVRGRHMKVSVLSLLTPNQLNKCYGGIPRHPCLTKSLASSSDSQSSRRTKQQKQRKDISTVDNPFDALTDNIPEKPVTFTEGASYSLIILAGLGVAAVAAYAVFKELIFQPKEYKVYGKALERVQDDGQSEISYLSDGFLEFDLIQRAIKGVKVRARIGSPITGYGQESRNRAARQRIPNRKWTDEDGVERVEVNFYIRGPHGAGKVFTEMFKDKADKQWKFTYLIVEIKSPSPAQLMLESYVPALSG
ncbi:hypothetical protein IFM89_007947 [Coptis chinensis]|uniref:Mitochondrial import inner membrane translocase subunit Tim21 n=1 Tax=Coptis chinensis TaxID=261450 RepID=A0A835IKV3_9MAGN|nr:hypothetical protein IFM89_007947 [Coptis chinensis]